MSYGKRGSDTTHQQSEEKRSKREWPSKSSVICHYCKKPGHRQVECRKRQYDIAGSRRSDASLAKTTIPQKSTPASNRPRRGSCFVCQSNEHYANACPRKTDASGSSTFRRRVDLCSVNPTGTLTHNGEQFPFSFDSGSECSLLRNSVKERFSGPIFETDVTCDIMWYWFGPRSKHYPDLVRSHY